MIANVLKGQRFDLTETCRTPETARDDLARLGCVSDDFTDDGHRSQWLTVEDLVSFEVGGVPVFLRMDLAFRDAQGRVVIVDWKTGRGEGRFNEIQLAGYALYAARQGWVTQAEEIQTELAYLAIPRYVRRSVDARKLDHARAFIEKSAERMKALLVDPALNLGRLEDFAMIDRPQLCRRCNFRRLCFPPAAVAAAEAPQPSAAL